MSGPTASVVIPAYRAADTIVPVLRAVRDQVVDDEFEVVVVASGDDPTAAIVRHAFPGVTVVDAADRLAPGAARNLGIDHSRGDIVAFLAADCVPHRAWLRRRIAAHRAGWPLVGGMVDMATPTTRAGWAQYFSKFWGMLAYEGRRGGGSGPLFHLSYLRSVLAEFGPFAEEPIAGEDADYNHRLVSAGHQVWFDAAIRVRHLNARQFADVVDAQREQGAATGALCRSGDLARFYAPSVRGGRRQVLHTAWRAAVTVARHRPRWIGRFALASPLVVRAIAARRRAFADAYHGRVVPVSGARVADTSVTVTPARLGTPVDVTVVVPAFDESDVIGECIDSLLAQTCPRMELVVVDDGSRDTTAAVARARGVPVLLLAHHGPAHAKNAGARWARGRVVVFVDADLRCAPECIEKLAEPILASREIGTFTRDIAVANPDDAWGACWSLRRGVAPGTYMPSRVPERWANFRAVDRAAFLAAGGYDDCGYGEDMTLAPKLGALASAVPGARMWHHNPDSLHEVWESAKWFGKGSRVREVSHPWRRHAPTRALRRGLDVGRRSRRPRYVVFSLVYDTGVLAGLATGRLHPGRHAK